MSGYVLLPRHGRASKGSRKNKFQIFHCSRVVAIFVVCGIRGVVSGCFGGRNEGIITFWLGLKALNVHSSPLYITDLEPSGVKGFVKMGMNLETRFGGRRGEVIEYGFVAVQGVPCPVLGYLTEEPVVGRVPLRGAGRVVGDSNRQSIGIAELDLQPVDPGTPSGVVGTAAVGQG